MRGGDKKKGCGHQENTNNVLYSSPGGEEQENSISRGGGALCTSQLYNRTI